mmetsp:Transcript_36591/g.82046  ORF Transcript_36591/g.82046 Transcript_36591/m.82046 type:complete len:245 (-) Transcript_36591:383-1117(-)
MLTQHGPKGPQRLRGPAPYRECAGRLVGEPAGVWNRGGGRGGGQRGLRDLGGPQDLARGRGGRTSSKGGSGPLRLGGRGRGQVPHLGHNSRSKRHDPRAAQGGGQPRARALELLQGQGRLRDGGAADRGQAPSAHPFSERLHRCVSGRVAANLEPGAVGVQQSVQHPGGRARRVGRFDHRGGSHERLGNPGRHKAVSLLFLLRQNRGADVAGRRGPRGTRRIGPVERAAPRAEGGRRARSTGHL